MNDLFSELSGLACGDFAFVHWFFRGGLTPFIGVLGIIGVIVFAIISILLLPYNPYYPYHPYKK